MTTVYRDGRPGLTNKQLFDIKRFMSKVILPPEELIERLCWMWAAGKNDSGYGQFAVDGWPGIHSRQPKPCTNAHRAAYELFVAEVPAGLAVCHECDVRACVSPYHQFLGTAAENMRDMVKKGRAAWQQPRPVFNRDEYGRRVF